MIIYSQKMAAKLMLRGFVLLELKPNEKHSRKNIFIFKDTIQIREAMKEISNWYLYFKL